MVDARSSDALNLAVLTGLRALTSLGLPVLLGTSRKSTLGRLLDLPADRRVEATLATTALGIEAGVDIIRVRDGKIAEKLAYVKG